MEQIYHVIVQIKKDKWDTIKYYDDDGNITSTAYSYTLHLNKFVEIEVDEIRGIFFNENYIELKDHKMSCDSIGDMIQIESDKLPDIDFEYLIYFYPKKGGKTND